MKQKLFTSGKNNYYTYVCPDCGSQYTDRAGGNRQSGCGMHIKFKSENDRWHWILDELQKLGVTNKTVKNRIGVAKNGFFVNENTRLFTIKSLASIGINPNWIVGYSCNSWLPNWDINRCAYYLLGENPETVQVELRKQRRQRRLKYMREYWQKIKTTK